MPRRTLSMRHRIFSSSRHRQPREVESAPERIHIDVEPPTPPPQKSSPYLVHQTDITTALVRTRPNPGRANKALDRLSGRWDRSTTRLPVWEAICDEMFATSQRLELNLDFETELRATQMCHRLSYRNSRVMSTPSTPSSPKSRQSTTSSGKRILKNIPTVKGGFWNMCMRSVPKIKFVRKFEDSDSLMAGVGAK